MTHFDWSRQLDARGGFTLTQQKLTQYASNQQLCLCMLTISLLTVTSLLMLTPDERFVSQSYYQPEVINAHEQYVRQLLASEDDLVRKYAMNARYSGTCDVIQELVIRRQNMT